MESFKLFQIPNLSIWWPHFFHYSHIDRQRIIFLTSSWVKKWFKIEGLFIFKNLFAQLVARKVKFHSYTLFEKEFKFFSIYENSFVCPAKIEKGIYGYSVFLIVNVLNIHYVYSDIHLLKNKKARKFGSICNITLPFLLINDINFGLYILKKHTFVGFIGSGSSNFE